MDPLANESIKGESSAEGTAEEYDTLIHLAQRAVFIDVVDKFFDTAVEAIKEESVIGIDAKVVRIDRRYEVILLSISIQTHVYQFDILKLGMPAFDNGLRSILESKIQKVIHNSRLLSSCLNHKYSVKLDNVFDTQVSELIIEKNLCGEFPKYVCSLGECTKIFLGIPLDIEQFNKDDTLMWIKRPLSQSFKTSAAQNAVFLLPLQKCIKTRMFSSLKHGINIFLKTVRDASSDEAIQHTGKNYLVPQEFLQLEYSGTRL
jgi:hypothetical protein